MICNQAASEPEFFVDTSGVTNACEPLISFTSREACPLPAEPLPWYFYIYIILLVLVSAVFNM
jgi:hypothetical protein